MWDLRAATILRVGGDEVRGNERLGCWVEVLGRQEDHKLVATVFDK